MRGSIAPRRHSRLSKAARSRSGHHRDVHGDRRRVTTAPKSFTVTVNKSGTAGSTASMPMALRASAARCRSTSASPAPVARAWIVRWRGHPSRSTTPDKTCPGNRPATPTVTYPVRQQRLPLLGVGAELAIQLEAQRQWAGRRLLLRCREIGPDRPGVQQRQEPHPADEVRRRSNRCVDARRYGPGSTRTRGLSLGREAGFTQGGGSARLSRRRLPTEDSPSNADPPRLDLDGLRA